MKISFGKVNIATTVLEPFSKGPWEPNAALDFLALLSRCLTRAEISHWVTYGALLGLVRQNSLLAWDDDIDIAIAPGVSFEAVSSALREAGLQMHKITRCDGRVVLIKTSRDGIAADLFLLADREGRRVSLEATIDGLLTMSHPVMDVVDRSFAGRAFPVPADAEAYLAHLYGSQWRVPARNWSWKHSSANRLAIEFSSLRGLLKYARSWLRWQWKNFSPPAREI